METGRTKIKNIERGEQKPTPEDLAQMSKVLDVPPSVFRQGHSDQSLTSTEPIRRADDESMIGVKEA